MAGEAMTLASAGGLGWPAVSRWWVAPPRAARALTQPRLRGRRATAIGLAVWLLAAAAAGIGEVVAAGVGASREHAVPWLLAAALLGLLSLG